LYNWQISGGNCAFFGKPGTSNEITCLQLTSINTVLTPSIEVTHIFTCPNGQTQTLTRTIAMPAQGIFIGARGQVKNLSDYECVLPGNTYAGGTPVYVSGRITVDKKSFAFSGTEIFVQPGDVGFDVPY